MIFLKTGIFNTSSGWIHTDNFNKRIDTDGWWWPASTAAARATFKKKNPQKISESVFYFHHHHLNINFSPFSLSIWNENKWKCVEIWRKKKLEMGVRSSFLPFLMYYKSVMNTPESREPEPANIYDDDEAHTKTKKWNFPKWCWRAHTHVCAYLRYPRLFAVWTFKRA